MPRTTEYLMPWASRDVLESESWRDVAETVNRLLSYLETPQKPDNLSSLNGNK